MRLISCICVCPWSLARWLNVASILAGCVCVYVRFSSLLVAHPPSPPKDLSDFSVGTQQAGGERATSQALQIMRLLLDARLQLQPAIKAGNASCGNRLR